MSVRSFAKATLFCGQSPACLWRHPGQATRLIAAAAGNSLSAWSERVWPVTARECPVCGWRGRRFRTFLSADEIIPRCICPLCLSFDRHRLLVKALQLELSRRQPFRPQILLGFSLSTAMRYLLEREGLPRCYCSDVVVDGHRFAPDFLSDLRQLAVAGAQVDWIFCSHVLEHIPELDRCLAEIARILRPGGVVWIQVPMEPDLPRSERLKIDLHRAHAHAWRFGRDFAHLIQRPDWGVQEFSAHGMLDAAERERFGIHAEERCWIARKV